MGRGLLCAPEEAKRLKKAKQIASSARVQALPNIPEQKTAADRRVVREHRCRLQSRNHVGLGASEGPCTDCPCNGKRRLKHANPLLWK
jgi:hypothetical protein